MYVRFTKSKKSKHPTIQIVEGVREGKKVKQKIIASLGVYKNDKDKKRIVLLAENLIFKLEKEGYPIERKVCVKDLIHIKTVYDGFGMVVDRLMQITGFSQILKQVTGKRQFNLDEIIKLLIVQRMDEPSSKLRTFERQAEHGFQDVELQHIYRAMDSLDPLCSAIQKRAFETACEYATQPLDCFFFDVTTLYFESVEKDELKDFGFSKDQKTHMVQVVLALVVNSEGIPIAYETFKGNLAETKTLIPVLESLRKRFLIQHVTIVCDRGMASRSNIDALQASGFNFVIATKLKALSKKNKINDLSKCQPLPNQENIPNEDKILFYTMSHPQYEKTTLIVTYSRSRAEKDKKDRERLLNKLTDKLAASNETSIKKVISNSGYKKFTNVKEGSLISLNQEAILMDASWDGFHGIAVSEGTNLSPVAALSRYSDLWRVEEAFRVAKCTLKTRPIFHWKSHRIKSHVLLCFMNLFIERFLELLLKQNSIWLTPDKIRHALNGVHSIYYRDKNTDTSTKMLSTISPDAEAIFKTLNISWT